MAFKKKELVVSQVIKVVCLQLCHNYLYSGSTLVQCIAVMGFIFSLNLQRHLAVIRSVLHKVKHDIKIVYENKTQKNTQIG